VEYTPVQNHGLRKTLPWRDVSEPHF